jgi:hypothetical protein
MSLTEAADMPLRLWSRFRIVPGLRVNLSRSGLSPPIGHRGAWYTLGPHDQRMVTRGLPRQRASRYGRCDLACQNHPCLRRLITRRGRTVEALRGGGSCR